MKAGSHIWSRVKVHLFFSCSVGELSISVLRAVSPLHSVLQSLGIPAHCAADQVLVKVAKMFDKGMSR